MTLDKGIINAANAKLNQSMRPWNDSIYLEYRATGVRVNSDNLMIDRLNFFNELLLAECVDYSGVYLKKIEESIIELAKQRSWTYSAHDGDLSYFNGRYFIDLYGGKLINFFIILIYVTMLFLNYLNSYNGYDTWTRILFIKGEIIKRSYW